jgi:hypothetical protein
MVDCPPCEKGTSDSILAWDMLHFRIYRSRQMAISRREKSTRHVHTFALA